MTTEHDSHDCDFCACSDNTSDCGCGCHYDPDSGERFGVVEYLDWMDPEADNAHEVAARYGVTATLEAEIGPGGGWAVYRFEGTTEAMAAFQRWYDNVDG